MKIALISDIHGNFNALQAVFSHIEKSDIDQIICLGDIATLGPQPLEVIAFLRQINGAFIMGNHDAALLDLKNAPQFQIAPPLVPSLEWTLDLLKQHDLNFLRTFPNKKVITLNKENALLCYHGSPQSNIKNILSETASEEIDLIFNDFTENIVAGGHTHIQMLRQHNGRLIINPGSVGKPFKKVISAGTTPQLLQFAEYAIIHIDKDAVTVAMQRVAYDIQAYLKIIRQSKNPLNDWLIEQYQSIQKS